MGWPQSAMEGINFSFFICGILMLVGLVMTVSLVKTKSGTAEAASSSSKADAPRGLLESIMKTDIYALPATATVHDAMQMFIERGISAAPIVNEQGEPVGFISDGDILKRLAKQGGTYIDPIALIANTVEDRSGYDERRERPCRYRRGVPHLGAEPSEEGASARWRAHRGHNQPQRHHTLFHGGLPGHPHHPSGLAAQIAPATQPLIACSLYRARFQFMLKRIAEELRSADSELVACHSNSLLLRRWNAERAAIARSPFLHTLRCSLSSGRVRLSQPPGKPCPQGARLARQPFLLSASGGSPCTPGRLGVAPLRWPQPCWPGASSAPPARTPPL